MLFNMRYTKETFIQRAQEVHGDLYDYSQVVYVNGTTPVTLKCPVHNEFEIKPAYHLQGGGCPVCAKLRALEGARKPMTAEAKEKRRQTNLRKYGATTFAGSKEAQKLRDEGKGAWSKDARKRAAKTCEERFGAKTWAESDIGRKMAKDMCASAEVRQQMSERAKSDVARQHYQETSQKHFGVDHWTKSTKGKQRLHELFFTDEERKARSERMLSEEVQAKIQKTSLERYGTPYYWQSEEGRMRLKRLLNTQDVQDRIIATKKKRGTLNSSKAEKMAYELLIERFGQQDVICQYRTDARYPFACDFYIPSEDLFIELNASWLHGFHWFDDQNEDDISRLNMLMEKAEAGKPMYQRAVYIWTYDDLRKRQIAEDNHIHYLVFWDNDLTDFKAWLNNF